MRRIRLRVPKMRIFAIILSRFSAYSPFGLPSLLSHYIRTQALLRRSFPLPTDISGHWTSLTILVYDLYKFSIFWWFFEILFCFFVVEINFGKSLSNQIEETLLEWRDKFLWYKELKKCLKFIEAKAAAIWL